MSNQIERAYRYCESVTKLHARSFYFAAKFLPAHKQRAVFPIYAFCRHVDDEIDEITDGDEAKAVAAVEEWRQNLQTIYRERQTTGEITNYKLQISNEGEKTKNEKPKTRNEKPKTENPKPKTETQNLVFLAWRDLLAKYDIPQNLPLDLIAGVVQDTRIKRYENFEELYVYCYRVASTVGLMASEILGYSDARALEYAEAMGVAMQLTNILRDVSEDASMGRIYLPQEDLRKFSVTDEQISNGRMNNDFIALMKFQIARARDFYARGERGIALLEKDSRFTVLLAARVYAKILDEIERQRYDVFSRRAHTSKTQKLISLPKIWFEAKRL